MSFAPIVLFVYKRLEHTKQTVDALKKNELAAESPLIIFSDGPKAEDVQQEVINVREYIRTIEGFKSLEIIERAENWGLADSIIDGVTTIVNQYNSIIVLEDDLVISPFFLNYMNDALAYYSDNDKVISIHGYNYPIENMPETFFIKGADCWGWATWKRGWDFFEKDGEKLLSEIEEKNVSQRFDLFGAYPYMQMLKKQIAGKNNSWAIRWYASAFLKDKLTLYPGVSLVRNIGCDDSGENCSLSGVYDTQIYNKKINIGAIEVKENQEMLSKISVWLLKSHPSLVSRVIKKAIKFFNLR